MKKRRIFILVLVLLLLSGCAVYAGGGDGSGSGDGSGGNAPTLESSSVPDGSTGVSTDVDIVLNFSNNVVNIAVKQNNIQCFTMKDSSGNSVAINVAMGDDQVDSSIKRIITIEARGLKYSETYTLYISGNLSAKNGNLMGKDISLSFTTAADQTVPSCKAHSFSDWSEVKAAGCEEPGEKSRVCIVCGMKETEKTEALGHVFGAAELRIAATIGTEGESVQKCVNCGLESITIIPCSFKDEVSGVVIEADKGVFAEGSEIELTEYNVTGRKSALSDYSKSSYFSIKASLNGQEAEPDGFVHIIIPVPGEFTEAAVYYIDGDSASPVNAVLENGTADFSSSRLGVFAIVDLSSEKNDNTILYAVIAALVLAAAAAVVIIVKKKKSGEHK